jgi:replicative DNA helicase
MMFSAEMAHDQLVLRQLAAEIGCSPQRLKQVQASSANQSRGDLER